MTDQDQVLVSARVLDGTDIVWRSSIEVIEAPWQTRSELLRSAMSDHLDVIERLIAEDGKRRGVLYVSLCPETGQASISIDPVVLERLGRLSVQFHIDAMGPGVPGDPECLDPGQVDDG